MKMYNKSPVLLVQSWLFLMGSAVSMDDMLGPETLGAIAEQRESHRDAMYDLLIKQNVLISADDVAGIIETVSIQTTVPVSYLLTLLRHESQLYVIDGTSYYNPSASAHKAYKGLAQMGSAAWQDASRYVSLPDYYTGWSDATASILAAAGFYLYHRNAVSQRDSSLLFSENLAYILHNQGIGVIGIVQTNGDLTKGRYFLNQSDEVRDVIAAYNELSSDQRRGIMVADIDDPTSYDEGADFDMLSDEGEPEEYINSYV